MRRRRLFVNYCLLVVIGPMIGARVGTATQKVAFVTSVSGSGDLGSWPDAGSSIGLAAGDAICRNRATVAGLANPQDFIAWLSDSSDDAYCRIHGLSGKKSNNCGLPNLPGAAGPWVRTDGYPFGAKIGEMVEPDVRVYAPVRFDELGQRRAPTYYWTNTSGFGELESTLPSACNDWTSAGSENVLRGSSEATSAGWTIYGSQPCSSTGSLLCMEVGSGSPLPPFWEAGAKIFVTAAAFEGDLGGISGAFLACRNRAAAAGLPASQTFRPWLSDEITNVADDVTPLNFPFVRMDGVKVADNGLDLLDGELLAPINVTQYGVYLRSEAVWTGSYDDGTAVPDEHCFYWVTASPAFDGMRGVSSRADYLWTFVVHQNCDRAGHLYCYSNAVVDIFYNGFESGDTSAWSSTQ